MKKVLWLLALILFLVSLSAVNIRQSLEKADDLSVGDRFLFDIRADVNLKSVSVPDTLTNFLVLKAERKAKGTEKTWLQLTIVPLLPGSHAFPKVEVKLETSDGNQYFTDRFRLNIIPVRAEKDTLLVDIKPVEKYRFQLPLWLYLLLLLVLAVLAFIYILTSKAKKPPQPKPVQEDKPVAVIPDPAWKSALNRLDELLALDLINKGEYIQHHYQLSQILRQFLEKKYRFAAGEMTTSEILWVTQRIWVEQSAEVLGFLRFCDIVKFAKHIPSRDEVETFENWLRSWLQAFEVAEAQQRMATGGTAHA